MSVNPLHHISLSVTSLEKSLTFYRDILGMKVTLESTIDDSAHIDYLKLQPGSSARVAMLQVGPPLGAVQLIEWSNTKKIGQPLRPGSPGIFLIAFELSNETIDEILTRLATHNIYPWSEPKSSFIMRYGEIRTVVVEDPDGVMIEFLELPSKESIQLLRSLG